MKADESGASHERTHSSDTSACLSCQEMRGCVYIRACVCAYLIGCFPVCVRVHMGELVMCSKGDL